MTKPKFGFFKLTSCSGCQIEMTNLEDKYLDLYTRLKILNFNILQQQADIEVEEDYDIVIVEGAISTPEEEELIKKIREKTGFLIAIGACAVTGGIPSMRNIFDNEKIKKEGYKQYMDYKTNKAKPIDEFVKVDYYIRGCPPVKEEIEEVIKLLLIGRIPESVEEPVCTECRIKENECLLQKGLFCIGPLTHMGCGAICPSNGLICNGCRGPLDDMNLKAQMNILEENGIKKEEVERLFRLFAPEKFKEKKTNNENKKK